jgi:hypothetical protein
VASIVGADIFATELGLRQRDGTLAHIAGSERVELARYSIAPGYPFERGESQFVFSTPTTSMVFSWAHRAKEARLAIRDLARPGEPDTFGEVRATFGLEPMPWTLAGSSFTINWNADSIQVVLAARRGPLEIRHGDGRVATVPILASHNFGVSLRRLLSFAVGPGSSTEFGWEYIKLFTVLTIDQLPVMSQIAALAAATWCRCWLWSSDMAD